MHRQHFLAASATAALATVAAVPAAAAALAPVPETSMLKAPRLKPGDRVGLISPAGPLKDQSDIDRAMEQLALLQLRGIPGKHVLDNTGYLAGTDEARAEDFNTFARDPDVRAIFATRGGYGTMRILDMLDYDALRRDPKIVLGFSDITAMLNAITQRTGLVTFHAPVASRSTYTPEVVQELQKGLMSGAPIGALHNNTTVTITAGSASGRLVGGNLALVSALRGTPYEVACAGNILLLEDVHEAPYQLDRMLTSLLLAGDLQKTAGIAAGIFIEPDKKEEDEPTPQLAQTLRDRLGAAGRPAVFGMQLGHILNQWVLPIGLPATLDASAGTLTITEAAVS